ncbi:MAG: YIP1 family protein [Pirellulaceae bacterium]
MVQHQMPLDDAVRKGLPWESGEKSIKTFWETAKLILRSPTEAFGMVKRDGGMLAPMMFAIAGGLVGALFSAVYGSIRIVIFGFMAANVGEGPEMAAGAGMLVLLIVLQFGMALAGGTVGVVIGLFMSSAIYHVVLMMLRGANYPFEATFAVVAYVTGATSLIQVVPLCGKYVYGIVAMVYAIIGLSAVQKISGGKAAAAVLLPGLICGVLIVLLIGVAVFFAFTAGAGGF